MEFEINFEIKNFKIGRYEIKVKIKNNVKIVQKIKKIKKVWMFCNIIVDKISKLNHNMVGWGLMM